MFYYSLNLFLLVYLKESTSQILFHFPYFILSLFQSVIFTFDSDNEEKDCKSGDCSEKEGHVCSSKCLFACVIQFQ